jgi:hypothetical protein
VTSAQRSAQAIVAGAGLSLCLAGWSWTGLPGLAGTFLPEPKPALTGKRLTELERLPARPGDRATLRLQPIAPVAARLVNAAIPFADTGLGPARPFRFGGTRFDRERAVGCLALAAMAEAGGSDAGQRAVIQVVLNRVRHPAFAKTVCGVVFQGSERRTGCQFTFTCDGSLARRYSDAAWAASKRRAREALAGRVFALVGSATHYHTDWVHPVWSSALEKIARVDTHLFFRWPGYWGSRDAARIAYRGGEPARVLRPGEVANGVAGAVLAAEATANPGAEPAVGDLPAGGSLAGGRIVVRHPAGTAFLVRLAAQPAADGLAAMGRELCNGKRTCRVLGWVEGREMPAGFPVLPRARDSASFSYVRASADEQISYDCNVVGGAAPGSCLPARPGARPSGSWLPALAHKPADPPKSGTSAASTESQVRKEASRPKILLIGAAGNAPTGPGKPGPIAEAPRPEL